eukprot:6222359-Prorocentrum_lima.AAC.1
MLEFVVKGLMEDEALTEKVGDLMKAGLLAKVLTGTHKVDTDKFNRSACRWHDLSRETLMGLLQHCENKIDRVAIRHAQLKDKNTIKKLFVLALNVATNDRLFSKSVTETKNALHVRYNLLGKRLQKLCFNQDSEVNWSESGCFEIIPGNK